MTDAVHKSVIGVCRKFNFPPSGEGWHTFEISVDGWEHPVKLSTKKAELINQAKLVGQQRAVWGYLESDGKENPNRPGTHFKNRWLDSIAPDAQTDIAETPAAPHPAEQPDAPPPPVDWDAKDLRKHRQAAVAISVSSWKDDPLVSEQGIFARAERIVQFVYSDYQLPEDLLPDVDESEIPFG